MARYHWTYPLDDYLDGLQVWATGAVREGDARRVRWAALQERARATFAERFPDPLNDFREVILATATKPG